MLGSSEWSSGCESGWTLYLDHSVSSFPSSSCFKDINGFENGRRSKDSWSQNYVHPEEDEEEDLSMMSDASSGPRNICEEDSVKKLNSVGPKKQNKSEKKRRNYEKTNSVLDDTASSHILQQSAGDNKIEQTFPESTLDYSQGFSATHIQEVVFSVKIEMKSSYFGQIRRNLYSSKKGRARGKKCHRKNPK
ncbi:protein SOB FIVE-LIKE 5-like isoform X1 [Raphanus sativus]|uniref:Protein SOB FIVE-LIKE 5-like isoform X1 n=1 Tax=Raphanus sativus TaxID=3726 RepID=A0A9W3DIJ1_RAPSA|nr:protein SOB FIVE-LIKE 5-like isoform X1 [Raphanus sativus]